MSTDAQHIEIVDGDNQFELYAQLFQWDRPYKDRKLFSLTVYNCSAGEKVPIKVIITGIRETHRNQGKSEFKIYGEIPEGRTGWNESLYMARHPWLEKLLRFEAYYDAHTRKGGTIRPL